MWADRSVTFSNLSTFHLIEKSHGSTVIYFRRAPYHLYYCQQLTDNMEALYDPCTMTDPVHANSTIASNSKTVYSCLFVTITLCCLPVSYTHLTLPTIYSV